MMKKQLSDSSFKGFLFFKVGMDDTLAKIS
jgi:hypothetical protein